MNKEEKGRQEIDKILEDLKEVLNNITKENNSGIKENDNTVNNLYTEEKKGVPIKEFVDKEKDVKKEKMEGGKLESYQTLPETQKSEILPDVLYINSAIFYLEEISDVKDKFFDNVNTTLKKLSKKPVMLLPVLCKGYNSLDKDLILRLNDILEEIKKLKIEAVFLIVNEITPSSSSFIEQMSSFTIISKDLSYKDVEKRSTYLDISVDLLLSIK